jgi:hypothetical protein
VAGAACRIGGGWTALLADPGVIISVSTSNLGGCPEKRSAERPREEVGTNDATSIGVGSEMAEVKLSERREKHVSSGEEEVGGGKLRESATRAHISLLW